MEEQVKQLVNKVWKKFQDVDASRRYLIAVVGIPGSGKTTTAKSIVNHLNQLHHSEFEQKWPNSPKYHVNQSHPSHPDVATSIPLDGFHLPRSALNAMPNPEEARYRRGAAFTFDAGRYLKLVEQLRLPLEATTRTVHAPSFDHAIKDPVENDIHIPPTSRLIVLEGLYVALDRETWRDAAAQMDEIWLIDADIDIAKQRVAERNFKAGLSPSFEEALIRTEENDMRNAREIIAELVDGVTERIESVEDPAWKDAEGHTPDTKSEIDVSISSDGGNRKSSQVIVDEDDEPSRPEMKERLNSIAEMANAGAGM